jgi:hypothetical protein
VALGRPSGVIDEATGDLKMSEIPRPDRRTTIKWMLAAAAAAPLGSSAAQPSGGTAPAAAAHSGDGLAHGYGTDPNLMTTYTPGTLWPLTLDAAQRRCATVLCDLIIPADQLSPSASSLGVIDFIDEWISAPYPQQRADRAIVIPGLAWIDAEARRRFGRDFAALDATGHEAICQDICYLPEAAAQFRDAATFFARFRDLTAGGFYTTPAGTRDLGYVGNLPLARFDGPPPEVLKLVGLA